MILIYRIKPASLSLGLTKKKNYQQKNIEQPCHFFDCILPPHRWPGFLFCGTRAGKGAPKALENTRDRTAGSAALQRCRRTGNICLRFLPCTTSSTFDYISPGSLVYSMIRRGAWKSNVLFLFWKAWKEMRDDEEKDVWNCHTKCTIKVGDVWLRKCKWGLILEKNARVGPQRGN